MIGFYLIGQRVVDNIVDAKHLHDDGTIKERES